MDVLTLLYRHPKRDTMSNLTEHKLTYLIAKSSLFSPVSLMPIVEYGHQQSRSVD